MMNKWIIPLVLTVVPAYLYAGTPAAPILKVEADASGLLKAAVSVTAPSVDSDGTPLESISKLELSRDGNVVKVFDNINPGDTQEFTDILSSNGYVSYSAIAYDSSDRGEKAEANKVFVGVDVPLPPKSIKISAKDGKLSFTWPKTEKKGENGERVIVNSVSYILEILNSSYQSTNTLIETKGQSFEYAFPVNSGEQDLRRFGLRSSNSAGYSEYLYARVVVGAPYYLPFKESFACGVLHGMIWQEGDCDLVAVTDVASDHDGGSMCFSPADDASQSSLNLGKISMTGVLNPRMTFKLMGLGEGEKITVKLQRSDGAEASMLTVSGPVEDWSDFYVDLSQLKNEEYLIPKFIHAEGNTSVCYIDDIKIYDPYTTDLGVMVKAPESSIGSTPVIIELTNEGLETIETAYVKVFTAGKYTCDLLLEEPIAPGETVNLETSVNIEGNESVEIKAVVKCPLDVNPANDTASAEIIPLPADSELSGAEMIMTEDAECIIYLPDGRLLPETNPSRLTPGLYIINGNKVIIK